MLNGFQSRINKRNEKYFMQFLFFICTTKPSMSSHIRADRHSFHTIINNHWEYQHSRKLVGNKHIKNLSGFVYLSLFHSTFSYSKSTSLTLLKEPLSNNSRTKKEALELFSAIKTKIGLNIQMKFEILFLRFYCGKKGQAKYPPLPLPFW